MNMPNTPTIDANCGCPLQHSRPEINLDASPLIRQALLNLKTFHPPELNEYALWLVASKLFGITGAEARALCCRNSMKPDAFVGIAPTEEGEWLMERDFDTEVKDAAITAAHPEGYFDE